MVATVPEIPQQRDPAIPDTPTVSARVPLAVAVVDLTGRISHWSSGARRLFGFRGEEALGRAAADILPVTGVLDAPGYPTAGRFRTHGEDGRPRGSADILWWAYPLAGPDPGGVLVLATDAAPLRAAERTADAPGDTIGAGFARHTDFPHAEDLARGLPEIMPGMSPGESGIVAARVLDLGYPVLVRSRRAPVPVTPDRGAPRPAGRRGPVPSPRADAGTAPGPPSRSQSGPEDDDQEAGLEYAAVRRSPTAPCRSSRPGPGRWRSAS
ncbi:PAS domain-containing protein [Streptomyces sp. NPDC059853]|uniref:PAS domain-containing protein n=1 Tax=Streptomyces sp. NPDC059853 TaxID=3346973 RepID=UPI003669BFDA